MSYDLSLSIDTGAPELTEVDSFNITYNVHAMIKAAGRCYVEDSGLHPSLLQNMDSIHCLHGLLAADALRVVNGWIDGLAHHEDEIRPLEAENGWGTFDQLFSWLWRFRRALLKHPKTLVRVH